jgi:hypothetical protein
MPRVKEIPGIPEFRNALDMPPGFRIIKLWIGT